MRRTCRDLLKLSSKEDSTTWGKTMELTNSGKPKAQAWYSRSTREKSYRDDNSHDAHELYTHQFTNPPVHTAEQFRPSAPAPPPSPQTRSGFPPATYPGTQTFRHQTLDASEREEEIDPDSAQDIDLEMERLRNEIKKFSQERDTRIIAKRNLMQ